VAGVLLFALGLGLGWPRAAAPNAMAWEAWSPERVTQLQKQGRGIYVDFTARWCATCQVNKKVVFGSDAVTRYFRDNDIVALKADWTNADPRITAELAKWDRSAVPFNLVYRPGRFMATPVELPELLTPQTVLDAFQNSAGVAP
ncbi:MAG: thioredoxin family protein, partial [Rhodanobacter sp.]